MSVTVDDLMSGRWREPQELRKEIARLRTELLETKNREHELLDQCDDLRANLMSAENKNRNSLVNNLCQDHRDKQQGKPCLACVIENMGRALDSIRFIHFGPGPHCTCSQYESEQIIQKARQVGHEVEAGK